MPELGLWTKPVNTGRRLREVRDYGNVQVDWPGYSGIHFLLVIE